MKFGLFMSQNIVSEWTEFYLNYHELKKSIKFFENHYKSHCKAILKIKFIQSI